MNTRLLVMLMVSVSAFQGEAGGDVFTLTGSDFLAVTSEYTQGDLYDTSSADVQSAGSVDQLSAHNSSNVTFSGGSADQLLVQDSSGVTLSGGSVADISAFHSTLVHLSGGSAESIFAGDVSTVNVSGGTVTNALGGYGNSEIELTGGQISTLDAGGESLIMFYGYGWSATGGDLRIEGDQVFGTGILSGFWDDGTAWSTHISYNRDTATIRLVLTPTPCGECEGKVRELTLRYTGTDAEVRVEQKGKKGERDRKAGKGEKEEKEKKGKKERNSEKGEKRGRGKKSEKRVKGKEQERHEKGERNRKGRDVSDGVVVFEGDLAQGELFTFVGLDDKGTLGTEISLFINDELDTKIHTSCSKPIYPGMTSGLFEVVEGYSLEGGLICPLETEPPDHGCK